MVAQLSFVTGEWAQLATERVLQSLKGKGKQRRNIFLFMSTEREVTL